MVNRTNTSTMRLQALSFGLFVSLASLAILSPACSTAKTDASTAKSGPSGEAEVSGSVSDDDPTEFKQADEAVQIGGVNLVASGSYNFKVYRATSKSGYKLLLTKSFPTASFSFSIPTAALLKVVVTRPDGRMLEAPIPAPNGRTKAFVNINKTTNVAAQMLNITVSKAQNGDSTMVKALENNLVPVVNLMRTAASVLLVVSEQTRRNEPVAAIDLTKLTTALVADSVLAAESDPRGTSTVAKSMSQSAFEGIYHPDRASASGVTTDALAFRGPSGLTTDVAYKSLVSQSDVTAVAYQTYRKYYSGASSDESAAANATSAESQFSTTYSSCIDANGCAAEANSYTSTETAPAPVTETTTTDGGGTTGSTSGGSTGGTTDGSTGGSTGGTCMSPGTGLAPGCGGP